MLTGIPSSSMRGEPKKNKDKRAIPSPPLRTHYTKKASGAQRSCKVLWLLQIFGEPAFLLACLAPSDQSAILLMHHTQPARAATDIAVMARGIAEDQGVRRHVARYHRARAHQRECTDGDAAHDHRARANRCRVCYFCCGVHIK